MSDIKLEYAAAQNITWTLASLANAAYQECTAVDNTTNKYLDALVRLRITLPAGSPSGEKVLKVHFYAGDSNSHYTDNATGSNAGLTPRSPTNLLGPFIIQTPTGGVSYEVLFTVAQYFGGILPPKWGLVIQNASGLTLDSTEGNHAKQYQGIYNTVA